jgi:hypothetical protein
MRLVKLSVTELLVIGRGGGVYLAMRLVNLPVTEHLFFLVVQEKEKKEIMTFLPGYEAGQTASYCIYHLLEGTGERGKGDHDLCTWLRGRSKLPATEPLFLIVAKGGGGGED